MGSLFRLCILTVIFLFAGNACADSSGVVVDDPYVRAIPPGMKVSAGYMTLNNNTAAEKKLVAASSDSAKNVELHEHVHKDGMMQMREVESISIPANSSTKIEPGGYHIMLIGLTKAIKEGDVLNIELEFNDGEKQLIKAEVRKADMGM